MLTGPEIAQQYWYGKIKIVPWLDVSKHNPNSVNLTLNSKLLVYVDNDLDMAKANQTEDLVIPDEGIWLYPGELYLASTVEKVGSDYFVPMVEGRSSLARLGLNIHQTGGFIDLGFYGQITLEISVVQKLKIYPRIEVCQVAFFRPEGVIELYKGKYQQQEGPTASRMFKELQSDKG